MTAPYRLVDGGILLFVRLTPRGGKDAIDGLVQNDDGSAHIKIRVSTPAQGGKANAALSALLAKQLGVARSSITLASGATSRQKRLKVEGDGNVLAARLDALMRSLEP